MAILGISDDFSAASIDAAKWDDLSSGTGTTTQAGGQLVMRGFAYNDQAGVAQKTGADATDREILVKIVDLGDNSLTDLSLQLVDTVSGDGWALLITHGVMSTVYVNAVASGSLSADLSNFSWDVATDPWFKIAHVSNDDTIRFSVSPDGATWAFGNHQNVPYRKANPTPMAGPSSIRTPTAYTGYPYVAGELQRLTAPLESTPNKTRAPARGSRGEAATAPFP
jgi:hypothetical protein